jgi:hypothetical protein
MSMNRHLGSGTKRQLQDAQLKLNEMSILYLLVQLQVAQ